MTTFSKFDDFKSKKIGNLWNHAMKKTLFSLFCICFLNSAYSAYNDSCTISGMTTPYSSVIFFSTGYPMPPYNNQVIYDYSINYPNGYKYSEIMQTFLQYSSDINCVTKDNYDVTQPQVDITVINSNSKKVYFSGKIDYIHQELDCRCTGSCDVTKGDFIQCDIIGG